ncbi:hypothetical protein A7K73_01355 [Candidatus Methylacidiphilum fumarolicum]|nr:hypothetical protein A7K73_01355 [Candidatus Methylacidiphilum fumarolicum]TFE76113.1 hypothetical protein A7K72_00195 [Candidatus Methylacidiphilum fumarolicum]
MDAVKVWETCRNVHFKARKTNAPWPRRDKYHKATARGVTPCMPKGSNRSFAPSTQPWKQFAGTAAMAAGLSIIHIRTSAFPL